MVAGCLQVLRVALLIDADEVAIGWKADAEPAGPPSKYAAALLLTDADVLAIG